MKIKNRQDMLVMLVVVAAGLFVGVNFIFTPLQNWWLDRQAQVHQLQAKVKEGSQLIRREDGIRSLWADTRNHALPPSMSQAEQQFLSAMGGWLQDSGAVVTSIMPQWKIENTNYMTLNCRVETAGDLGALSKLIYAIEKGPLEVRLDSVELSSHDNAAQQMTLGLELNALALLQNDKK
jgi:hypothetical protein